LTTKESFNSSAIVDRALNHHMSSSSSRMGSHFNNTDYEHMSNVIAGRNSSLSEESISETEESFRSIEKPRKHKKKINNQLEDKLTGEDRQLIKELSKQGRGRPKEVRNLLNEGANAKAITKDGVSLIHLAVKNRHFECVPVLVEANADINSKLPDKLYFYFSLLIGNKLLI
jgi:ankyrin repeat protein